MTHHARRPGDQEMRAGYGGSQDGSRKGRTARTIGRRILVCRHLAWILNMNSRMFCREEMEIEWSRPRPDRSRRREGSRKIREAFHQSPMSTDAKLLVSFPPVGLLVDVGKVIP